MTNHLLLLFFSLALCGFAAGSGVRATCIGGTIANFHAGLNGIIATQDTEALVFSTQKSNVRIPYRGIKMVEYGQDAGRRVVLAYLISPVFLLLKSRKHFVTLQFADAAGHQQALVLRIEKNSVRSLLATLEARTGHTVRYQDEEARKFRGRS